MNFVKQLLSVTKIANYLVVPQRNHFNWKQFDKRQKYDRWKWWNFDTGGKKIDQPKGTVFPQFKNLPASSGIAATGSVYDTKVVRKRQVKDINLPDFEKQECLKWANWWMLRDVRRRHMFKRYHPDFLGLNSIRRTSFMPMNIREDVHEKILLLPRDSTYFHLQNRCVISGRARGKLIRWRISRHFWREFADHNLLSGVLKARW